MSKTNLQTLAKESPIGKIFDFSDRVAPMLVKEIRQGLRSMSFTILFMATQAILCLTLLITLALGTEASSGVLSMLIFMAYIVAVCGIQPVRAANAINAEVKGNTIDLLAITNLSAWKIVQGKWISLMAQSLLFAVSLLPYLIFRYFLGEMQLFAELVIFALIFVVGGIITALALGLSALPQVFLRFISVTGLILFSQISLLSMVGGLFGGGEISTLTSELLSSPSKIVITLSVILGFSFFAWNALDFAASAIAPLSENRALKRRIVMLSFLGVAMLISAGLMIYSNTSGRITNTDDIMSAILLISTLLFLPNMVIAFTEPPQVTPNVIRELSSKKKLGPLRYLFYPGWPSGGLFVSVAIVILLVQVVLVSSEASVDLDELWYYFSFLNFVLVPAALVALFKPNVVNRLTAFVVAFVIINIVGIMLVTLGFGTGNEEVLVLFSWMPAVAWGLVAKGMYLGMNGMHYSGVISLIICFIICGLILFFRAFPHLRALRAREKSLKAEETVIETTSE